MGNCLLSNALADESFLYDGYGHGIVLLDYSFEDCLRLKFKINTDAECAKKILENKEFFDARLIPSGYYLKCYISDIKRDNPIKGRCDIFIIGTGA